MFSKRFWRWYVHEWRYKLTNGEWYEFLVLMFGSGLVLGGVPACIIGYFFEFLFGPNSSVSVIAVLVTCALTGLVTCVYSDFRQYKNIDEFFTKVEPSVSNGTFGTKRL